MATNMTDSKRKKYGNLQVEPGGQYAERPGKRVSISTPLIHDLDRRMHEAFVAVEGKDGTVPSRGVYDIRCHAQHPARVLGRRCIEMREAGAPVEQAVAVFEAGVAWVREVLLRHASQPRTRRVKTLTPDPAAPIKVPSPLYGYRIATVGDLPAMANLPIGARATLLDTSTHRLRYAVVRSWSGEGVNLDDDIHLSTVDDDLEQLGSGQPVTDGSRYWLLIEEAGR